MVGAMEAGRPRGEYLADEVGRLVGVPGTRIGQWARRGYIRPSQDDGDPHVYAWEDVAEALVVHELLAEGVPLRAIHRAIAVLAERGGSAWPLSAARLAVRGERVLALDDEGAYDVGERGWQQALGRRGLREVGGLLARGGWAAREDPRLRHIEVDPERLSGRPTIRGRRLLATDVAALAQGRGGDAVLREDFGLSAAEIEDARRWAAA